jgi:hypothetical protein
VGGNCERRELLARGRVRAHFELRVLVDAVAGRPERLPGSGADADGELLPGVDEREALGKMQHDSTHGDNDLDADLE